MSLQHVSSTSTCFLFGGGLWQIYIKDETTQSQNAYYLYFSLQRIFRLYVETTLCLWLGLDTKTSWLGLAVWVGTDTTGDASTSSWKYPEFVSGNCPAYVWALQMLKHSLNLQSPTPPPSPLPPETKVHSWCWYTDGNTEWFAESLTNI